jgi:hypothetical protein
MCLPFAPRYVFTRIFVNEMNCISNPALVFHTIKLNIIWIRFIFKVFLTKPTSLCHLHAPMGIWSLWAALSAIFLYAEIPLGNTFG